MVNGGREQKVPQMGLVSFRWLMIQMFLNGCIKLCT